MPIDSAVPRADKLPWTAHVATYLYPTLVTLVLSVLLGLLVIRVALVTLGTLVRKEPPVTQVRLDILDPLGIRDRATSLATLDQLVPPATQGLPVIRVPQAEAERMGLPVLPATLVILVTLDHKDPPVTPVTLARRDQLAIQATLDTPAIQGQ